MFKTKVKIKDSTKTVLAKASRAAIENLGHAGAALRLAVRRSIRTRKKPSAVGTPPHSRKGQLRRAILFAIEKATQTVVVGPDFGVVADSGRAHELGGRFRQERYDKRPFMGPGLLAIKDRLSKFWYESVR